MALYRLDLTLLRKASARGFSSGLEVEGQLGTWIGWRERWGIGLQVEVPEDAAYDRWALDQGDQLAPASAACAAQNVDGEHSAHQNSLRDLPEPYDALEQRIVDVRRMRMAERTGARICWIESP
ncbi:MAG: hypothetical protein ACI8QC_002514 [Planctomycetota bacterium]|jgi:hypothetical protein